MQDTAPLEGDFLETQAPEGMQDYLEMAARAYRTSTDYLNSNYRKRWERGLYNFQSKHPPGSKYHTDKYKHRSRLFRPKTRTSILKGEAALAAALFSTEDAVTIEAHDKSNEQQATEAEFWHSLLNYRLTKTLPWFRLTMGAYQETGIRGAVVAKVEWDRRESQQYEPMTLNGAQLLYDDATPAMRSTPIVERNEPRVRLVEIENLRVDPASDWTDPVNTSPYVIELIPMFVGDILDYMEVRDPETDKPYWHSYSKEQIAAVKSDEADTSRRPDEENRYDPDQDVTDFDIAWVHLNFLRVGGKDLMFYTLGTDLLLSDPAPVEGEIQFAGKRPYVIGVSTIEAHTVYPQGVAEMAEGLQASANDMINQRRDNINLVLNKRYRVQRGSNTDLISLQRSIPGGVTLTDDLNAIAPDEMNDVTGSAYQEQDRLNSDFDDLTGVFSGASVATNRKLNETVGGMELLNSSANAITEYFLRVFTETWVEPVIQRLVLLEQLNEDKETRARFAKQDFQPTGEGVDVSVSVGFGATNPEQRLMRVVMAVDGLAKAAPEAIQRLNMDELTKEVFGAAGYRDGDRFLREEQDSAEPPPDPEAQANQMKAQTEQMKAQIDQAKLEIEKMKVQLEEQKIAVDAQIRREKIQADLELGYAKLRDYDDDSAETRNLKREELKTKRDIAGMDSMNKQNELAFKADTGRKGI